MDLYTPNGTYLGEEPEVLFVCPKTLTNSRRLDLAVKFAYANKILGDLLPFGSIDPEYLYDCHIQMRTGGVEPNSVYRKQSTDDYKYYFQITIQDIKNNGFDANDPIKVSQKTGLILNGAHRLAAALALGVKKVPVVYDPVDLGREWDIQWFSRNGFSADELMFIAQMFAGITHKLINFAIIWPGQNWCEQEVLNYVFGLLKPFYVARHTLSLESSEFLFDVYSYDKGIEVGCYATNIIKKAERIKRASSNQFFVIAFEQDDFESALSVRESIRNKFGGISRFNFDVIHFGSSKEEVEHLRQILLSPSTMHSYSKRPRLSCKLRNYLLELNDWCSEKNIRKESLCIVGGAVYDLFGMKSCDDIDIVLPYSLRRNIFDDEAHNVSVNIDVVRYNYARQVAVGVKWTDDDLIFRNDLHTICRGFKFANFDIVFQRKRWSLRDKDISDISSTSEKYTGLVLHRDNRNESLPDLPESFDELAKLAESYHISGLLKEAADCYRRLCALFAEKSLGHEGLGVLAVHRGDYRSAINYLETAKQKGCGERSIELLQALKNKTSGKAHC